MRLNNCIDLPSVAVILNYEFHRIRPTRALSTKRNDGCDLFNLSLHIVDAQCKFVFSPVNPSRIRKRESG